MLDDFGGIHRWNPGVASSGLTSQGPVAEGSTRHCDLRPFGGVDERIERYEPNHRMTVHLCETFKLPISGGVADFYLAPHDGGTELTLRCTDTPNRLGRLAKATTDKQLRKALGGLAEALRTESESLTATPESPARS